MDSEPNPKSSWQKIFAMGGGFILLILFVALLLPKGGGHPRESSSITMVSLPPVLALPPPPPPQEQTPEEKKEETQVIDPNKAPPSPDDDLAKAESDSSDGFGIRGSKNGRGFGLGGRWGWYTSQLQSAVQDALHQNPKTRHAGLRIEVRFWPDASGAISRVEMLGSTGDPALDETIKNQVFANLRLQPPPEDMPKPVTLRITGRPPG